MKKETLINNELFTDYKAVAHAADLIERKIIDADRIEIIPLGPDKRAFAKDIEDTTAYYSEKRRHERIRISTNREGLYDMLPEGLFHRPPTGSAGMDEESMIKDIRDRREEEKEARLFFTPFDAEINYVRIMTELYENMLDKKTTEHHLDAPAARNPAKEKRHRFCIKSTYCTVQPAAYHCGCYSQYCTGKNCRRNADAVGWKRIGD
jgi:hypothetical protein